MSDDNTDDTADDHGLITTDPDRDDVVVRREWDDKLIDAGTYSDSDGIARDYRGRAFSEGPFTLVEPEGDE